MAAHDSFARIRPWPGTDRTGFRTDLHRGPYPGNAAGRPGGETRADGWSRASLWTKLCIHSGVAVPGRDVRRRPGRGSGLSISSRRPANSNLVMGYSTSVSGAVLGALTLDFSLASLLPPS